MWIKVDLHVHTSNSKDGVSRLDEILKAAMKRGLHGIAITDHDVPLSFRDAEELSGQTGLLIIPGVEITTKQGHLLALCFEENFKTSIDVYEAADLIKSSGGLLIVPHPLDKFSQGIGERLTLEIAPHAIEVYNASSWRRFNRRAFTLVQKSGIPGVAGSDAHHWRAVGAAYTVIDVKGLTIEDALKSIREGRVRAIEGYIPLSVSLLTVACKAVKKLKCLL